MNKQLEFEIQLQRFKNNLFKENKELSYKTILITSSINMEGKTTIATSFAEMFANSACKTILVDGSADNPYLHKIYKLKNIDGLFTLSQNGGKFGNAIQKTYNEFLDILPAGKYSSTSIDTGNFNNVINVLKTLYSIIIFDSSPVSTRSETLIMASCVDAVILVVESLRTKWQTVQRSIKMMEDVNANLLGVVINKQRYFIPDFLYKGL